MLSKIENGNTSPSLSTLQTISNALSVPLTAFFRQYEEQRMAVHTKAGEGVQIEREGTRAGHQYNLLGHIGGNSSSVIVEPYLITLDDESDTLRLSNIAALRRFSCWKVRLTICMVIRFTV